MIDIKSEEDFYLNLKENKAVLVYFSTPECNVCKILKPKINDLISNEFNKIKTVYVNCENFSQIAAQNNVFTVPTIIIYFEEKELFRKSRNIGLNELSKDLARPYSLFFEE
ncbi:MAG: thiol reductase thioredoxin [Ignavibacteriae bacterium]|nr:MAG: thiol reductase thioredoxin [Ignavibacteriota bacterium]